MYRESDQAATACEKTSGEQSDHQQAMGLPECGHQQDRGKHDADDEAEESGQGQ